MRLCLETFADVYTLQKETEKKNGKFFLKKYRIMNYSFKAAFKYKKVMTLHFLISQNID